MARSVSSFPDKMLRCVHFLPWPASAVLFRTCGDMFRSYGKRTGALTRIRFGDIEVLAPLEHPAVFWRYRPAGFNMNFVVLAQQVTNDRTGMIIDVGANIGDGIALLRGHGVDSPVLAVEGAQEWFDLLQNNTAGLSGIDLEHVLLGSDEGDKPLALYVHDGTSKLVKSGEGVRITSLDALLSRRQNPPVALLKTDTDGFDLKVLYGSRSLLTAQCPVVFSEVDDGLLREQGNSAAELIGYLVDCGYTHLIAWDNGGKWLDSRPASAGIDDLIARYPGGLETPYLDIAAFGESDRTIIQLIEAHYTYVR